MFLKVKAWGGGRLGEGRGQGSGGLLAAAGKSQLLVTGSGCLAARGLTEGPLGGLFWWLVLSGPSVSVLSRYVPCRWSRRVTGVPWPVGGDSGTEDHFGPPIGLPGLRSARSPGQHSS